MPASPLPIAGVRQTRTPQDTSVSGMSDIQSTVSDVLAAVRSRGDAAVAEFAARFDGSDLTAFEVGPDARRAAVDDLDPQTRADTEFAIDNVRRFAEAQRATMLPLEIEIRDGVHLGHRILPIERVGCYVPGGRYPLLSAPVMTIVPAKVAGVDEVIACLPPNAHRAMIAGCHLSGADRIFRIGGAQAIAAMAFGTESVPRVDKIVGPGNAFVNEAKRQVFGAVGIDQLAGPSEIYVLADETGDAEMIATDLLAQAEHDTRTRVGLITTSRALAGTSRAQPATAVVAVPVRRRLAQGLASLSDSPGDGPADPATATGCRAHSAAYPARSAEWPDCASGCEWSRRAAASPAAKHCGDRPVADPASRCAGRPSAVR